MNDVKERCSEYVQSESNPAAIIVGNTDDRTTARTSYPSSVNESESLPYACKNSVENALTGYLYIVTHLQKEDRKKKH